MTDDPTPLALTERQRRALEWFARLRLIDIEYERVRRRLAASPGGLRLPASLPHGLRDDEAKAIVAFLARLL